MKKVLFFIIILCLFSTPSYSAFYMDGMGAYVDTGDIGIQTGGGGGFGFGGKEGLNFLFRSFYTNRTENYGAPNEALFSHLTAFGGIEYAPQIWLLSKIRLNWTAAFLAGYSISTVKVESSGTSGKSDGYGGAVWTGLRYDATQNISPFIECGYHKSFLGSQANLNIQGAQFIVGVRFYFSNQKKVSENY